MSITSSSPTSKEALALENNLIKQRKPRFNILLRDDKTYPYVKLTLGERYPARLRHSRLRKDGSAYYGPYFPANLAYRIVDLIHRNFLVPSRARSTSPRYHPGPACSTTSSAALDRAWKDLTTPELYTEAVRDVSLFLEGKRTDLERSLQQRMTDAAAARGIRTRRTLSRPDFNCRAVAGTPAHRQLPKTTMPTFSATTAKTACSPSICSTCAAGKIVDRREFFWEDLPEFGATIEPAPIHVDTAGSSEESAPLAAESFHPGSSFSRRC